MDPPLSILHTVCKLGVPAPAPPSDAAPRRADLGAAVNPALCSGLLAIRAGTLAPCWSTLALHWGTLAPCCGGTLAPHYAWGHRRLRCSFDHRRQSCVRRSVHFPADLEEAALLLEAEPLAAGVLLLVKLRHRVEARALLAEALPLPLHVHSGHAHVPDADAVAHAVLRHAGAPQVPGGAVGYAAHP
eukprot:CAMPEP_0118925218 /NCGR_PEP_ID=MMETSP1169-20130426/3142_1 /TAXON_ID=36882 /ORGANISM="Pyramimonas obovata, Strain CCMP722" /LENGTH=186 /DNA_ID=CAMNT_0006866457 /DNA_START=109 /DNA_END=670 /DNA_ORIENTATION=-